MDGLGSGRKGGVRVCFLCFGLGLLSEFCSVCVLFGVSDSLCMSLCTLVVASLGFLEVMETLGHVVVHAFDFPFEFAYSFLSEFSMLSWSL